jgi:hypothetical protein
MNLSKTELRAMGRFHLAKPAELDGMQEWAEWLEAILHGPCSAMVINN